MNASSKTNSYFPLSKLSEKIPLHLVLIVPFVLQIFAAVGTVGYFSFKNGQKAVEDLAGQLMSEVGDRVHQHLTAYMATPLEVNAANTNAIDLGILNLEDSELLAKYLRKQIQQFDSLTLVAIATEQPNYVDVAQFEDSSFLKLALWDPIEGGTRDWKIDALGNRIELIKRLAEYDHRKRPWYQTAVTARKPVWNKIYGTVSPQRLLVSTVQPFYNQKRQLLGVLSASISLSKISHFLSGLKVGKSGQIFIIERSGELVATSTAEQPFRIQGEKPERLSALASSNALTQESARYLSTYFGDFKQIGHTQTLSFTLGKKRQFIQVFPFKDERGLDWLIAVAVPEADFMEQIDANTRNTISLCALALVLATGLGILTARWLGEPILKLSKASQEIAAGKLERKVEVQGVSEVRVLAQSFNQMTRQLSELFHALEQTNEELEARVQQRTSQLKEANEEIMALNEQLKGENIRMSAELGITRQLQQMILPKEQELTEIAGLDISGFMSPADEVGGDYYDILQENGIIKIGIGDVTGHGLESGVLMIMTQMAVRALTANNETDPVKFLSSINRAIYSNLQRMNCDKSLTLSLLEYHDGLLKLTGQHEEMIIVRADGQVERIDTINLGFPIGLNDNISQFIGEAKVSLNSGDVVVLYTDGITEAEDINKRLYGIERLIAVVTKHFQKTAHEIRKAVIEELHQYIGEQRVYDDITLVVLKQK